jgi:L-2,4-diaminobutyric acid acetyltransferase
MSEIPGSGRGTPDAGSSAAAGPSAPIELRPPALADAQAMWSLVRASTLDDNSPYAYLMLARYHAGTCAVAERDGALVGFVSAFVPPEQPDTLFVWQVGVSEQARGTGLATRLIASLLERYLEATVTPSNLASLTLFRRLAERLGTRCRESRCFPSHLFPGGGDRQHHEEELLLRIGPFTTPRPAATNRA